MNISTATARALVSALLTSGVRDVVISPGSRSAPLTYAVAEAAAAGLLDVRVRIDEREAGFLALGIAKGRRAAGTERPVAVVTTSGSAVANLHPAVLEDRGLDAAVSAVAAQAPFPVDVSVTAPRLDPRTEAAIYFAVSEGLTNAVKHSGARSADVAVSVQDGPAPGTAVVVAGVRDFGRGGARVVPGGGLSGIQDRIRSAGGRFFVTSPAGGPTEVIVELPLTDPATTPRATRSTPETDHAAHHGGASAPGTTGGPGQGPGGAASSYPAAGNAYPAAGEEN